MCNDIFNKGEWCAATRQIRHDNQHAGRNQCAFHFSDKQIDTLLRQDLVKSFEAKIIISGNVVGNQLGIERAKSLEIFGLCRADDETVC